jgi:hypothetical protein
MKPTLCSILSSLTLIIMPFLSNGQAIGSNGLTVKGIITQNGDPLEDASIKVYNGKNRLVKQAKSHANGRFRIRLPLDGYYVIAFSKKDLVTKRLLFRTRTPDHRSIYHPFELEIVLYNVKKAGSSPEYDPDMPLGIVEYFPEKGDFDYVEDYTLERLKEQDELLSREE